MTQDFDVIVLGGGPGGYVAALRGAQLGLKVCLIEKEFLGGVCLNKGCIPSKTLLAGTELYGKILKAGEWGIDLALPPVWNKKKLFDKKNEVILRMRQGLETLCQKRKVHVVKGEGVLIGPKEVRVGAETYHAKNVILATGSKPRRLDFGVQDRTKVFFSEEALGAVQTAERLLILGGGPEGVEFALVFQGLGAKVTLVETKERLLPGFDRDAGAAIKRVLTQKGVEVLTEETVTKLDAAASQVTAHLKSAGAREFDAVLVSAGRVPNSENIGLEKIGVRIDEKKSVSVSATLETGVAGVYAIGDLNGNWMMAHSASYEGYVTAGRIAGLKEKLDYSAVPSCVYSYPEVAEVGLNEEKAKARNIEYQVGRFSFMALGRSHAKGQTEGFAKLIGDAKTDKVLGGVIVGDGASELINMITLAIKQKLTVGDLRTHISPHPSASEAVVEAAHMFFKEGLHFA